MSQNKVALMDRPEVGNRVRLKNRVDRFPEFTVPAGAIETIHEVIDRIISVKLDVPVEVAAEFDNCLHFYDATSYSNPKPDG